ncbi:hypothetical protein M408DRAFT_253604 [Serendipita vermifera MAFF 305830]|uniref:RRM domain-containing protein n=1 Tax=Serendipita vermifera MAFF 305830 TaxID=933852 RepID=A0A0C2WAZ6_SERVB|nr:hypothetical protein M408DRAFT_253604 [Serendipita vermifera MAFF 305830]
MLSGLSKRRIPIVKSSKPVVHSYRRFLASTPIRSAKPGIVANKPHYFAEGDTLGNDPNLSNSALRPAGEHFWAESEIQLPKKRIQLKRAAGDKLRRSDENKQFIPLGTPQNTRNTWEKYPAERTPSKRARSSNTDLGIQQRNGLSRNSSAKNMSVRHQEGAIVAHASQFLIIRDFKGVRSDLVKAVSSYMAAQLYLVPTRIDEKKARIDVLIKFATQDDAVNARSLLERLKTSLVQEPLTVEMIDETQYLSVLNPPKPTPSMERLVIQSEQKNDQKYRGLSLQTLRASSTLWIGNVPAELLEDKREIVAKFSKYGQVIDVKIRKSIFSPGLTMSEITYSGQAE